MSTTVIQPEFDYRRFAILYVDDEDASLRMFQTAFGEQFRIFTAPNAVEGQRLLDAHHAELGILMTDERMPGERGVHLLEKARRQYPRILRILTTAYSDLDTAIAAVNSGAIYKYIQKPWNPAELELVLRQALQFFILQQERDQLLRERVSTLHRLMFTDRLISMSLLSSGLNHHLRNSLVAIRTFLDLAPVKLAEEKISPDTLRDPHYWREFHAMAQAQISRITEMLDNLGLAATRGPEESPEPVDVAALLKETVEAARSQLELKQLAVQVHCSDSLPKVTGHAVKIQRLLELLLQDEIRSLPAGKEIVWILQPLAPNQGVEIIVDDNGPGLNAEDMRILFDPFFSRSNHPQDFGINLMACFFLVYHQGGRIEVDKSPRGGTRFRIHLPGFKPLGDKASRETIENNWSMYEDLYEGLISGRAEK